MTAEFPAQDFNNAIAMAHARGFQVAYSNEAFEIWYMLHFNYYDTGLHRSDYESRLTALLGHEYRKNSDTMYSELLDKQLDAIRNATRLLERGSVGNPALENPSTTVHVLVEELNKYLR